MGGIVKMAKNQSFDDLMIEEINRQFEEDMLELLENDDFYNEVMNIENILKMEGF